jgi:hypothetical protein
LKDSSNGFNAHSNPISANIAQAQEENPDLSAPKKVKIIGTIKICELFKRVAPPGPISEILNCHIISSITQKKAPNAIQNHHVLESVRIERQE